MMPEWLAAISFTTAIAVVGWMLNRGVTSILEAIDALKRELKEMADRQAKIEKDCVTWTDLEKERLRIAEHDRRITVIETTCKAEHGK